MICQVKDDRIDVASVDLFQGCGIAVMEFNAFLFADSLVECLLYLVVCEDQGLSSVEISDKNLVLQSFFKGS